MIINCCTKSCIFECEGQCTLTHVMAASEPIEKSCVYYKSKDKSLNTHNDQFQS